MFSTYFGRNRRWAPLNSTTAKGNVTRDDSPDPYERGEDARRLSYGCKFRFWSRLGCSGQNARAIIFSRNGLFQGCTRRNIKDYIFSVRFICSIHVLKIIKFFVGVKKGWATPRLVSFRGSIQNFRRTSPPLLYESPPGDDSQRRFLAQHSVATLMGHCFE